MDFRKAHDGLCATIRDVLEADPFTGDLFVFFNKRRDRVKILFWDQNGFWLYYKRLERGTFEAWRGVEIDREQIEVDRAQLMMLLEGIDTTRAKYRRYFSRSVRIDGGGHGQRSQEVRAGSAQ